MALTRKEEDELLKYAHIARNVQKHYAIRYNGYPDEIPYFFLQKSVDAKHVRGFMKELKFDLGNERTGACQAGDWIVIREDGYIDLMSDEEFRIRFVKVNDLSYQSKREQNVVYSTQIDNNGVI